MNRAEGGEEWADMRRKRAGKKGMKGGGCGEGRGGIKEEEEERGV